MKKVDNGIFPIKKFDKDGIVPINVISQKWYQLQHRPQKCF